MPASLVLRNLYLGGEQDGRGTYDLIVNCTTDIPGGDIRVAVKDNGDPKQQAILLEHLPEAVRTLESALVRGERCLVHCRHGQQRSSAVVAAYLMHVGLAKGVDDAVHFVRRRRPEAFLCGVNFREALERFEEFRASGWVSPPPTPLQAVTPDTN